MAEAQTAQATGLESTGSIVDMITSGVEQTLAAETPSGPAADKPKETPGLVDPLDEALFADEHLKTPEQIREKAALLRAEVKVAAELRRKAHNVRAEVERKEARFKQTKQATLQEKDAIAATARFLQGELAEIQSGDPDRFIAAVARLSRSNDAPAFWREVAVKLAQGPKPETKVKLDPEEKARIDALEKAEKERQENAKRSSEESFIAAREAELFSAASEEAHPLLHKLKAAKPDAFEAALRNAKIEGYRSTGKVIDNKAACDSVEAELRFYSELHQQSDGPNGDATRARDAAAPVAGQDGTPGRAVAKTEPAPSSPPQKSSTVTSIPSSLTGEPARAKRALSPDEQRLAMQEQLDAIGFFRNFGM